LRSLHPRHTPSPASGIKPTFAKIALIPLSSLR